MKLIVSSKRILKCSKEVTARWKKEAEEVFVDIEVGNKLKENKFRPKINWEQISHLKLFLFMRVERRRPLVDKFWMEGMEVEEGLSAEAPLFELIFCSNPSPSFAKISDKESPSFCEVFDC